MDNITAFFQDLRLQETIQALTASFSLSEIFLFLILIVLLMILVSSMALRRHAKRLQETQRKMLYELNQVNTNLPGSLAYMAEKTDPVYE